MDKTKKLSKSKFKLRELRTFSDSFKRQKVTEIENKQITVLEIVSLYGVSRTAVYNWLHKYSVHQSENTRKVIEMESEAKKTMFYKEQVSELERIVGSKQIEIDYLTKLLEIASVEFGVDIKKKFNTQLYNGSKSINPNIK